MTAVTVDDESGGQHDTAVLLDLATFMIGALGLHPATELAIVLVDEERMAELHVQYMDEPGPTDVLSFPMDELRSPEPGQELVEGMLGDIVLCPAFAARQAAERGRALDDELAFLVVHGMLHLVGFDHATQEEYDAMFARQDELLERWRAVRPA